MVIVNHYIANSYNFPQNIPNFIELKFLKGVQEDRVVYERVLVDELSSVE
jgi:hypothetical protein